MHHKALIQVKNTTDFSEKIEEVGLDRSAFIPSPLKMADATSSDLKVIQKLKLQIETPKLPQKTTLG